jgi:hypothetical protein
MSQCNRLQFVDSEGVPQIVQWVRYWYAGAAWRVTYFTGEEVLIPSEYCTPNMGLLQHYPQEAECKDAAIYAAQYYRDYLTPTRRIHRVK